MEREIFKLLKGAENSWWYQGRSAAVKRVAEAYVKSQRKSSQVLDVGAGFGAMLPLLKCYGKVSAFEVDDEAAQTCNLRGYSEVFKTREEVENKLKQFLLVGAFDVIEHVADDTDFVKWLSSLLDSEGLIIATVPAYQFLWSEHDVLNHHYHRYTKKSLTKLFESANLSVLYLSYWNISLFLPIAVLRLLGIGGGEALTPPAPINKLLTFLLTLESTLIPHISFPFGTSLIICAQKRK